MRILILAVCLSFSGCGFLADRLLTTTNPRPSKDELTYKENVQTRIAEKVGIVDTSKDREAITDVLSAFLDLQGVDSKYKVKVTMRALQLLGDMAEAEKLDFYREMLASGLKAGDPSMMLAAMQMMQMKSFKDELEARMPQIQDIAEKGFNWLLPAIGIPVTGGVLGLMAFFVKLLHRSRPDEKIA